MRERERERDRERERERERFKLTTPIGCITYSNNRETKSIDTKNRLAFYSRTVFFKTYKVSDIKLVRHYT